MAPSGNLALKSFQSYMVNDGLLAKVVEAIKAGEKEARSTGDIQTFEVFYKGFRQNIAIGRVMVIPAKVADSREDFPIALLYGTLVREFGGEEMADLLNYKIGDTEFDEYSKADLAAIKDKVFKNKEGKYESLVMFAPSWHNLREYVAFKFTKDDEKLSNAVRHLIFSAYFDPALSSAFNALMTDTSTDKLDVTNVTPKLNFPGIAENPLKDYPDMQKMGAGRRKIFLTKKTADAIEKSQIEPAEMDVFEALNQAVEKGLGVTEPIADVAKHGSENPTCYKCDCTQDVGTDRCEGCGHWHAQAFDKSACGELPIVEGTNVGPGKAAESQEPPKPAKDLAGPEGAAPIGIELKTDGTPIHEEKGKQAYNEKEYQRPGRDEEGTKLCVHGNPVGDRCEKCGGKAKTAAATGTAMAPQKEEIVLYNQQGGSDKEYRVVMTPAGKDLWNVEAFNGRRGKATTKAKSFASLPYAAAKAKFDEIANDKISGGYTRSVEEQHPEQQSMEALPDRSAGMTIQFANPIQVALFKGELLGQMSDGKWENSGPRDHWRPMADATVRVGKPGINFTPSRTYDLSSPELLDIVGDRMLFLAKAAKAYPNVDMGEISHAVQYFENPRKMEDLKDDWQKKYVETILKATGETDLEQFIAKVNGQAYGMGDLRKDLRAMKGVINEPFRQRMASLMKQARDRNETMEYNGHTYRLTTWEERDRLNINLTDECCQKDILDLWDENAREMIEDGFIDPRKMIQSAIEYADSVGLIDMEEATAAPSMMEASSEASRTAAKNREAMLAKRYAGRKQAEEQVPTADNILDEVLSDIGQAPIVKIPGDGEAATTPEAHNVPAPMKSEEPEQAKEQSAPEQEAKPFESKGAKKKASRRKIADVMDLLESGGRHLGFGSRLGASVAEDIAEAKSEVDFNKAEMADNKDADKTVNPEHFASVALPEKGTPEWHELKIALDTMKMPAPMVGVMGGPNHESVAQTLAKYGLVWNELKGKAMRNTNAELSGGRYADENMETRKQVNDAAEGQRVLHDPVQRAEDKPGFVASSDKTAYIPVGEVPDAPCQKCGQPTQPGDLTQNMGGSDQHITCPPRKASKTADDQRKDDVPVVPEGKPSEGAKQPVSDLSACAPEAHDVPPQVDSKTADSDLTALAGVEGMKFYREPNGDYLVVDTSTAGYYNNLGRKGDLEGRATAIAGLVGSVQTTGISQGFLDTCQEIPVDQVPADWKQMLVGDDDSMSVGVDPALVEDINEQTMMDEMNDNVDPLANAPGYREHSNSSAAQQGVSKDFWKE